MGNQVKFIFSLLQLWLLLSDFYFAFVIEETLTLVSKLCNFPVWDDQLWVEKLFSSFCYLYNHFQHLELHH
jgi:hypothetical protein